MDLGPELRAGDLSLCVTGQVVFGFLKDFNHVQCELSALVAAVPVCSRLRSCSMIRDVLGLSLILYKMEDAYGENGGIGTRSLTGYSKLTEDKCKLMERSLARRKVAN